ncbi:MAG: hypothetical protein QXM75_02770 [Candidatus Diapherotrites archaeon]
MGAIKRESFYLMFLLFFVGLVSAFTITTETLSDSERLLRDIKLKDSSISIDASPLSGKYNWQNVEYVFMPFYYQPIIENYSYEGRPKVSLKVKVIDKSTRKEYMLDCGLGTLSGAKHRGVGEIQACYRNDLAARVLEYKITSINGPLYLLTSYIGPDSVVYSIKGGESKAVIINFDVRFRSNSIINTRPEYTEWFSTQEQINAFGSVTGQGGPGTVGPTVTPPPDQNAPVVPPVVLPTDCRQCVSIIQCLACLHYNLISSIKRIW